MNSRRKTTSTIHSPGMVSLDLESQVLGALMIDNSVWKETSGLEEEDFTDANHVLIWKQISSSLREGKPVTAALIATGLGERLEQIGGRYFLSALTAIGRESIMAIPEIVERLRQLTQWRRLNAIHAEITVMLQQQEIGPGNALSQIAQMVGRAIESGTDSAKTKHEILREVIKQAREPSAPITTGIDTLDFIMQGGLVEGRTYGLGALYGRGKTILMGSISDNLNRKNIPHLVISLETPPDEIEIRNCARHIMLNAAQIRDPYDPMREKFLQNAETYMERIPNATYYEYIPGASIDKIQRMILRAVHQKGIKGVFIDYWQLITGQQRGQSEDAHFTSVINRIAALCRQEKIWSVVIAQTDEHGRPLRSTSILQAAGLFVHMKRDPNDQSVFFLTEKNNYGRYADAGNPDMPGAIFDPVGPHLRSTIPQDYAMLGRLQEDDN